MTWVAGVDGCRAGWFVVLRDTASKCTHHKQPLDHISQVFDLPEQPRAIAVDIPIGLLVRAERGGRLCDRRARELLGQPRARSVFSPPVRAALVHQEYKGALAANRESSPLKVGISAQCFGLFRKIRQVDQWIDAQKQKRVREVLPELCFYEMNGRHPMCHSKKKVRGLQERRMLLCAEGFRTVIEAALQKMPRARVAEDDILDACAACWTAERILDEAEITIPESPERDQRGLRMEMQR